MKGIFRTKTLPVVFAFVMTATHAAWGDSDHLGSPMNYTTGNLPRAAALGDFNEDGTYGVPVNYAGPAAEFIATGDFNEDGVIDIAVTNSSSANLSVLLGIGANGNGTGTFATRVNYAKGTTAERVVSGDFNEDGILDLAVSNDQFSSNSVSVLIGQGSGGDSMGRPPAGHGHHRIPDTGDRCSPDARTPINMNSEHEHE